MHMVTTRRGFTARITSAFKPLNSITMRATFMPPAVEPALAPDIKRAMSIMRENSGHLSKSAVAKPVVEIMLETWKKLWCRAWAKSLP